MGYHEKMLVIDNICRDKASKLSYVRCKDQKYVNDALHEIVFYDKDNVDNKVMIQLFIDGDHLEFSRILSNKVKEKIYEDCFSEVQDEEFDRLDQLEEINA